MRSIFLCSFSRRAFGKLAFLTLRDDFGTIQLYCEKARFLSDQFDELKNLVDIGDILGARELSVYVNSFAILTKSLLPLPDKYHGLTHVDKRYRQRYIDMISNPEVADVFRKRAKIVSELRKTVESFGFLEVENSSSTGIVFTFSGATGGAKARPFVTYHNSLGRDLYLRIATELHLKRMLLYDVQGQYPFALFMSCTIFYLSSVSICFFYWLLVRPKDSVLEWSIPPIDNSNRSGSMEFVVPPTDSSVFFPISVNFSATNTFSDLKVVNVLPQKGGAPPKFGERTQ
ncbi:lysine--tRNA ligase, chloroplastic/mitochondrial-like [Humulus lupulus]|uniref:lysine--tRNA ligase, chloroplastic/mitochondrial-like n=1 Tax=Humulus lupulus TaxID=3486 RepID=UPI002B40E245|nr:lysine--tRNA ligase, chloroplastic/mitochondrial-like [Humulus lupulus]